MSAKCNYSAKFKPLVIAMRAKFKNDESALRNWAKKYFVDPDLAISRSNAGNAYLSDLKINNKKLESQAENTDSIKTYYASNGSGYDRCIRAFTSRIIESSIFNPNGEEHFIDAEATSRNNEGYSNLNLNLFDYKIELINIMNGNGSNVDRSLYYKDGTTQLSSEKLNIAIQNAILKFEQQLATLVPNKDAYQAYVILKNFNKLIEERTPFIKIKKEFENTSTHGIDMYSYKGPNVKHRVSFTTNEHVSAQSQYSDLAKILLNYFPEYETSPVENKVVGVDGFTSVMMHFKAALIYEDNEDLAPYRKMFYEGRLNEIDPRTERTFMEGALKVYQRMLTGKKVNRTTKTALTGKLGGIIHYIYESELPSDIKEMFTGMFIKTVPLSYRTYTSTNFGGGFRKVDLEDSFVQNEMLDLRDIINGQVLLHHTNPSSWKNFKSGTKYNIVVNGTLNDGIITITKNGTPLLKITSTKNTKGYITMDFKVDFNGDAVDLSEFIEDLLGTTLPLSEYQRVAHIYAGDEFNEFGDPTIVAEQFAGVIAAIVYGSENTNILYGNKTVNFKDAYLWNSLETVAEVLSTVYGQDTRNVVEDVNGNKLPTSGLTSLAFNMAKYSSEMVSTSEDAYHRLQNPLQFSFLAPKEMVGGYYSTPMFDPPIIRQGVRSNNSTKKVSDLNLAELLELAVTYDFLDDVNLSDESEDVKSIGLQTANFADKERQFIIKFFTQDIEIDGKTYRMGTLIKNAAKGSKSALKDLEEAWRKIRWQRYSILEQNLVTEYNDVMGWNYTSLNEIETALIENPITIDELRARFRSKGWDFVETTTAEDVNGFARVNSTVLDYVQTFKNPELAEARLKRSRAYFAKDIWKSSLKLNKHTNRVIADQWDSISDEWKEKRGGTESKNETGNLILFKVYYKGKEVKITALNSDVITDPNYTVELNPILNAYMMSDIIYANEYNALATGDCFGHPNKGGENLEEIEALRLVAANKRNVIYGASIHAFNHGLDRNRGVSKRINIAVVKDVKAAVWNMIGGLKNKSSDDEIDSMDGSGIQSIYEAILEQESLKDAAAGLDEKTILGWQDKYHGTQILLKWAVYALTNERRRASRNSSVNGEAIFKKMHSTMFNKVLNMAAIFKSKVKEPLYFKEFESGKHFEIIDVVNINGKQVRRAVEVTETGQRIVGTPVYYLDNRNKTYLSAEEIVPENLIYNTLYDLDQFFGGCDEESLINGRLQFTDRGNHIVTDIICDEDLKKYFISYIVNQSAIKVGATNINQSSVLDDNDISLDTMEMSTEYGGLQMNAEHELEDSEVSEMTQMISALIEKGFSYQLVKQIYGDIGNVVIEALSNIKQAIANVSDPSQLRVIFGKALIEAYASGNRDTLGLAQAFLVKAEKYLRENDIKNFKFPFSGATITPSFIATVSSMLTKKGIRRKYAGLAAVLTPSYNMIQVYGNGKLLDKYADEIREWKLQHPEYANVSVKSLMNDVVIDSKLNPFIESDPNREFDFEDTIVVTDAPEGYEQTQLKNVPGVIDNADELNQVLLSKDGHNIFQMDSAGRTFVIANINGIVIPFYQSSHGTDGKIKGAWYPFFGMTGNWLVKGTIDENGNMSYSPEIDRVTKLLNDNLHLNSSEHISSIANNVPGLNAYTFEDRFPEISKNYLPNLRGVQPVYGTKKKGNATNALGSEKLADAVFVEEITGIDASNVFNGTKSEEGNGWITGRSHIDNILNSATYDKCRKITIDSIEKYDFYKNQYKGVIRIFKSKPRNLKGSNTTFRMGNKKYSIYESSIVRAANYSIKKEKSTDEKDLMLLVLADGLKNYKDDVVWLEDKEKEDELTTAIENKDLNKLYSLINVRRTLYNMIQTQLSELQDNHTFRDIKITAGATVLVTELETSGAEVVMGKQWAKQFHLQVGDDIANILKEGNREKFFYDRISNLYSLPKIDNSIYNGVAYTRDGRAILIAISDDYDVEKARNANVTTVDGKAYLNGTLLCDSKNKEFYTVQGEDKLYDVVVVKSVNDYLDFVSSNSIALHRINYANNPAIAMQLAEEFLSDEEYENILKKPAEEVLVDLEVNESDRFERMLWQKAKDMFKSFELSLNMVGSRIPAQAMQSFQKLRVVAFTESETNDIYVNRHQTYLEGSDYDIDKSFIMTYEIGEDGTIDTGSRLSKYIGIEKSFDLNIPTGKEFELTQDGAVISENDAVSIVSGDVNVINKILAGPRSIKFEESSKTDERSIERYDRIKKHALFMLNIHEKSHVSEAAIKNRVIHGILKVVSDPKNQLNLTSPISMDTQQRAADKSDLGKDERHISMDTPSSKFMMQEQNMVGKECIGITAVALKCFFAKSYYYNSVLNDDIPTKLSQGDTQGALQLLNSLVFTNPSTKVPTVLSNLNLNDLINFVEKNELSIIERATDCPKLEDWNQSDGFHLLECLKTLKKRSNRVDCALELSGLLSAATDNAKVLILSKINATTRFIDIYTVALQMGCTFEEISSIMTHPMINAVSKLVGSNILKSYRGNYHSDDVINFYLGESIDLPRINDRRKNLIWKLFNNKTPFNESELLKILENNTLIEEAIKQAYKNIDKQYVRNSEDEESDIVPPEQADWLSIAEFLEECINRNDTWAKLEAEGQKESGFDSLRKIKNEFLPAAEEQTILGQLLGVNQGLKTSGFKQYNLCYRTEVFINKQLGLSGENSFSLLRFLRDESYATQMMDAYESKKKFTNILKVIKGVPHFSEMLSTLSDNNKILTGLSAKYDITQKLAYKISDGSKYGINENEYKQLEYFINDSFIVSFLTSKNVAINVSKDTPIYDGSDIAKPALESKPVQIKNLYDLATFKLWMETEIIPKLKEKYKDHPFIQSLMYSVGIDKRTGKPRSFYRLPMNMLLIDTYVDSKMRYQIILDDFTSISKDRVAGTSLSIADLFFIYNAIVNKEGFGRNSMTRLFEDLVNSENGTTLASEFYDFVTEIDANPELRNQFENTVLSENGIDDAKTYIVTNISNTYIKGGKKFTFGPDFTFFMGSKLRFFEANSPDVKPYVSKNKTSVISKEDVRTTVAEWVRELCGRDHVQIHVFSRNEIGTNAYIKDGVVHIDSSNADVPQIIHEYAHMILAVMKFSDKYNDLYYSLVNTITKDVMDNPKYKDIVDRYVQKGISGSDLREEVFCNIFENYLRNRIDSWIGADVLNMNENTIVDAIKTMLKINVPATSLSAMDLGSSNITDVIKVFGSELFNFNFGTEMIDAIKKRANLQPVRTAILGSIFEERCD